MSKYNEGGNVTHEKNIKSLGSWFLFLLYLSLHALLGFLCFILRLTQSLTGMNVSLRDCLSADIPPVADWHLVQGCLLSKAPALTDKYW